MRVHGTAVVAALCLATTLPSAATGQESPLVCAIATGVECDAALDCRPPMPEQPPPSFLHIDLEARTITLLAPEERRGETTKIQAVERSDDQTVLSGIETDRGWSIVVEKTSGQMTLSVTSPGAGFLVFGTCIPSDQAAP